MSPPVFLVLTDDTTHEPLGSRYIEADQVQRWLSANAPRRARCDVFTAAPVSGGHLVETLRRGPDGRWVRT